VEIAYGGIFWFTVIRGKQRLMDLLGELSSVCQSTFCLP